MSFQIDKVICPGGPSPWQRSHFRLTRLVADQEVVFCADKRQTSGALNPAIAVYFTSNRENTQVIHWKQIDEFIEPNWEKVGTAGAANLFWRGKKGAVFGYIRDGELFDYRWQYVCDANKITHFSEVSGPESNVIEFENIRPDQA